MIEPAKYPEKHTLDQKVKTYLFNVFKELSVVAKSDDALAPLGGRWGVAL